MQSPVIEGALEQLSGNLLPPSELQEKRAQAAQHLATVIELADVCYVDEDVGVVKLTGVLDTLSPETSSEGFFAALDYADQSLDPKGRSQVYSTVVECLVGSFEAMSNRSGLSDENRDGDMVNRNKSRIDAVMAILTTDIDKEPVIEANDASNTLSRVVDNIYHGYVELYGRDKKGRDRSSVVDQIQNTRLEIFEKAGPKSKNRKQLFSQALQIYIETDQESSPELRERALSYAIDNCPSMKDVSLEDIDNFTRYPTDKALKLLAVTDDPEVIATALGMAIEDFTPFVINLKRLKAYIADKKEGKQSTVDIRESISARFKGQEPKELEGLLEDIESKLEDYDEDIDNYSDKERSFVVHISEGVREVQFAITEKLLPLLSSKRGQSLFGLVYGSLDDDMARPAYSKDFFLEQCIYKLHEAYKEYAQHGKQEYDANQLRDIRVFLNGLKQPVEIDR